MLEIDCVGRLDNEYMISLYEELEGLGLLGNVCICGSAEELMWLHNSDMKNVAVSVSFYGKTPSIAAVLALPKELGEMAAVNVSVDKQYMDRNLVNAIHSLGYTAKTWTITTPAELQSFFAMGVDTILVDSDRLVV